MSRLLTALFVLFVGACAESTAVPFDDTVAERAVDCDHLREKIAAIYAEARAAVAELEAEEAQQLARLEAWYEEAQAALDRRYRAAVEHAETQEEIRRLTAAYEQASEELALEARRRHHEIIAAYSAEIRETIAYYLHLVERLREACDVDFEADREPLSDGVR